VLVWAVLASRSSPSRKVRSAHFRGLAKNVFDLADRDSDAIPGGAHRRLRLTLGLVDSLGQLLLSGAWFCLWIWRREAIGAAVFDRAEIVGERLGCNGVHLAEDHGLFTQHGKHPIASHLPRHAFNELLLEEKPNLSPGVPAKAWVQKLPRNPTIVSLPLTLAKIERCGRVPKMPTALSGTN
jgi:hypothetical protein